MDTNRLKQFIQRDFIYIIVCLLAILGCLYTLYTVGDQIQERDQQWVEYINQTDCLSECLYSYDYQTNITWGINNVDSQTENI